ncbi:DUF6503 family protein [Seonamhaeicola marinus]|uniref:Outer membrane lipoprotein-sorting protein n=1 Tax=Seonamhaeicola marinus TaxID=1912246 RepID=A0A5D0HK73_9FLAO|nr:DUF6503 family protein [Seonamhaeicola marinus]TYA71706.1 hypothetical protein FUA24_19295 [Seonamhaeicola marinus]
MKTQIIKIVSVVLILITTSLQAQGARKLITKVVEANGGINALHKLKDVSFDYTFKVRNNNVVDVSKERYIFNGEVSFAHYTKRQVYALPQLKGTHTQFFNGTNTVSKINGKVITDKQPAYIGHALRKTNYYWFAMMFKLLDPGVNHKVVPPRKVNGITYKVVEMTFGENVGESDDKYMLYINPQTYLIDQFLYTAKGFGVTDPSLMKVKYEKIDGVFVSTYRKYAPADWDGNVIKDNWTEQFTRNIKFNNGFDLENIQSLK